MARKFNNSDPTAFAAIKNVDRARKGKRPPRRRIFDEFPDIFDDLEIEQRKDVCAMAHQAAGGEVWRITRDHLLDAREAVMGR